MWYIMVMVGSWQLPATSEMDFGAPRRESREVQYHMSHTLVNCHVTTYNLSGVCSGVCEIRVCSVASL